MTQRILLPRKTQAGQHYLGGHYAGVLKASRIELKNVSYRHGEKEQILNQVNLVAEAGSTTCIVATDQRAQAHLLALIYGLHQPDDGEIFLDGQPFERFGPNRFKEQVSLVLQDPWMSQGTIAENICFGRRGVSSQRIQAVGTAVGLDDLIQNLPMGYDTVITGASADNASADNESADNERADTPDESFQPRLGQRRQIALARSLLRNPRVILLEEPTTDVTADDERMLLRAIETACRGRTAIIASRRLSVARQAETILVLDNGSLAPYQGGATSLPDDGQPKLWDLRIPPLVLPDASQRKHLRVVGAHDRRQPRPRTQQWGMTIGAELAPGYVATGLLSRTEQTDTWVAWCSEHDRPVRVRTPRFAPISYRAFDELRREKEILKNIQYAGAPALYDTDLDADMPYLVTEYLDSPSLATVAQQREAGLDQLDVLYTGFELAHTLQIVHDLGYVHLNLRSRQVRTRNQTIVITDFGSAQPIGSVLGSIFGPSKGQLCRYNSTAPEQLPSKRADPRMDIYALGALMHRAAAGAVATQATAQGVQLASFSLVAPDAPKLMASTIDRMLSPDPACRPTAKEAIEQFRQVLPRSLLQPRSTEIRPLPHGLRLVADN